MRSSLRPDQKSPIYGWMILLGTLFLSTGATLRLHGVHAPTYAGGETHLSSETHPNPSSRSGSQSSPVSPAPPIPTAWGSASEPTHGVPTAQDEIPPRKPIHPPFQIPNLHARPGTPASEVQTWAVRLATRDRTETLATLQRMQRYEPIIRSEIARAGIPQDLIYLALIESEFQPNATSRAGAKGMWQFMPGTARGYGLRIDAYVDERRDPVRATRAAVQHLSDLHRTFGSWHLAAAAYNAGEDRIRRALQRSAPYLHDGQDDLAYWSIRPLLSAETRAYVPKLLAAALIGRDPNAWGLFPEKEKPFPTQYQEISVPGGVSLQQVSRGLQIPMDLLTSLNPQLIQNRTPPGPPWPVRIPTHRSQTP